MQIAYRLSWLLLALAACPGSSSSSGSDTETTSDPSSESTATPTTTTTTDSTATDTTADPTTSTSTTEADPPTSSTTIIPGGPPSQCGPPCEETWTLVGDLALSDVDTASTDELRCLTRITGDLDIQGLDSQQLSGLQNLVTVEGSLSIFGNTITDLSPFACLEEVTWELELGTALKLSDLSALSALRFTQRLLLRNTAAITPPAFSPDFSGLRFVEIFGNDDLVDLDGMASWKAGALPLEVVIHNNDSLTDLSGMNALLASSPMPPSVELSLLPALKSLGGFDGLTALGDVRLSALPGVVELASLEQLVSVDSLLLSGMPLVADLQPLSQLEAAGRLALGDCWRFEYVPGMHGLTSLAGLSSLTTLGSLVISDNPQLTSLAGAEQLTGLRGTWSEIDNSALTQEEIAAFSAQVGQEPCSSDDPTCVCYDRPNEGETDTA